MTYRIEVTHGRRFWVAAARKSGVIGVVMSDTGTTPADALANLVRRLTERAEGFRRRNENEEADAIEACLKEVAS